jgi:signal transduction histidine kinase
VTADDPEATGRLDHARLLSLAAHEFRTPVSVVGGYLRMLQRDSAAPLTTAQHQLVDEAIRSCARLSALVDELSEVARLDASGDAPIREDTDLFDILRAAARESQAELGEGPAVIVDVPDVPAPFRGDGLRLRRALATVVSAVARERAAAGSVVVRGVLDERSAGSAVVVVGTAEEVEQALGAPREPLDVWRGGLGLGLPIAQRVIARHGGTTWAARSDSARPGRGAAVVTIPTSTAGRPLG